MEKKLQHPCVVKFCNKIGTHRFPSDEHRRLLWVQAVEQVKPGLTIRKHSRICSDHFKPTDFNITPLFLLQSDAVPKTLKKTAIPSVFPWKTPPQQSPSSSEDQKWQIFNLTKVEKTYARTPPVLFVEEHQNLVTVKSEPYEDPLCLSEADCIFDIFPNDIKEENIAVELETYMDVAEEIEIPQHEDFVCQEGALSNTTVTHDKSVQTEECSVPYFTIDSYKNDDKVVHFYTGLENFEKLMLVFGTLGQGAYSLNYFYGHPPRRLDAFDFFFITLLILRRHLPFEEVAIMYHVKIKQIYNIFITWIRFISLQWKNLDLWLDKESVRTYMPSDIYDKYPSTRVILDATEIPIKKPKLTFAKQVTFSSNKNRNTLKILIGITPSGFISYVSPCYGGSATDRQVIERSSILTRFDYNDEIMVDKGLIVQDIFVPYGVKVKKKKRSNRTSNTYLKQKSGKQKGACRKDYWLVKNL